MFNEIFGNPMASLPIINGGRSRSISRENPTGEKGKGGMATGVLGPSRKGAVAYRMIPPGEILIIADVDGPGIINHIWFTITDNPDDGYFTLSDVVLRFYWDNEETPSVEVPIGDFFLNGFSTYTKVNSFPIVVNPVRGYNCYFQMPFAEHVRITAENQHPGILKGFFYQVDYTEYDGIPSNAAYFHAQYRRERLTVRGKDYTILDNVKGSGLYVGTFMAHTSLERYWYGEGEMKFYLDGDIEYPTICGTGLEDYFGGGFGFVEDQRKETPAVETLYQTPFLGHHFFSACEPNHSWRFEGACPPMRGFYRFHILDPIRFNKEFKLTVQQIGTCDTGLFERQDDISTIAYWYQSEPHTPFPELPDRHHRQPR
ncbi:MAG: glycoside hydrolase family 172 protein [Sphaerochaetaceae bacterium]